jgi:hypothetical protein
MSKSFFEYAKDKLLGEFRLPNELKGVSEATSEEGKQFAEIFDKLGILQ